MIRIPDQIVQEIRDRVDIVDLVGRYVTLRQAGRNFKGLCPFHSEKTPSFNVHREKQIFHCFGCGAGGDVFGFLIRHENLSFPEAVRTLAGELGIAISEGGEGEVGVGERLHRFNVAAQQFFVSSLAAPVGEAARAYLAERGVTSEWVARFGIGFAPGGWDALRREFLRQKFAEGDAVRAGLLAERDSGGSYDRLRERITFPIQDVRGRIIGFGGRALRGDQEPKYLNTPETPLFRKRETFYGYPHALEAIRRAERAVVVEGYFDCIALAQADLPEVLATCGTALTEEHAAQLRRRTRNVVLFFDGDEAGRRAMLRALEVLLPQGLRVRAAELPTGEDPDSLLRGQGAAALRAVVEKAVPAIELVIRQAVATGVQTPWEKADAVAVVVPLLARVPDAVERFEFTRCLALLAGVELRYVEEAVRRGGRGSAEPGPVSVAGSPPQRGVAERHLRELARTLLECPSAAEEISAAEILELACDSPWRAVLEVLFSARPEEIVSIARIAERLPEEARALLLEIAAAEAEPVDRAAAARVVADILHWLRRQRERVARRALTQRLRDGQEAQREDVFAAKVRQLDERRARFTQRGREAL